MISEIRKRVSEGSAMYKDPIADVRELLALVDEMREALAVYGAHKIGCGLGNYSDRFNQCDCGLFALLKRLEE